MKKIVTYLLWITFFILHAVGVEANQFCFASAKTYYEQVYCELQAKGKAKGLPSFDQFKHNNEIVQASLLKLPAERNRIVLPPPKKPTSSFVEPSVSSVEKNESKKYESDKKEDPLKTLSVQSEPAKEDYIARKFEKISDDGSATQCQLHAAEIQCSTKRYRLVGNKMNSRLEKGVLSETNKLALPLFQPGEPLNAYVSSAYRQYIDRMLAIGLGGVTMTYARFAYLYEDLQSKNVDFIRRFELMYSYLKSDKASMSISEKIPVNLQLALQYCELLTERRYVCAAQGQNYIFELE